jgi:hypothetical protein
MTPREQSEDEAQDTPLGEDLRVVNDVTRRSLMT